MIVEFFSKVLLVETVKQSVKAVSDEIIEGKINQARKERISSALISIQQASLETRNFIDNKGYRVNTDLSRLWNDALKKSIDADLKNLPRFLQNKAKFWGKPQDWLKEKASMELVPKLSYLNDQCDMLLIKLEK
ncbi:hypothetical protein [Maribacter dokdonensis]|uniref:hypothetical protein n=1 Tax=Maribacter dokdonensis TaxID=320912 RepID=UPI0007198B8D|nr:hypothetical protein [Maribacter dokdonensis]KSA11549.1 hypothetical protein I600_3873 [Maribacter dokdonensis DSW-8]